MDILEYQILSILRTRSMYLRYSGMLKEEYVSKILRYAEGRII